MSQLIKKPISKLSILFVISILVPGSILVYFSIQNIVSQKELTEKRLLKEQNELATDLTDYFQLQLTECATAFFSRVDSLASVLRENISFLESSTYVSQVFVVDKRGEFIWPHFMQSSNTKQKYPKSREFLYTFTEAERSEFAKSALREAAQLYRKALKVATNKSELATATNGLARVLAKQGLTKQAHEQYGILANRYGSVIDENCLPFSYYALHQLIQFTSRSQSELIFKDIETILSRWINGDIPLTEHTELLLQEVSNLYAEQNNKMPQIAKTLPQQINAIRKLLSFVLQQGSPLKKYLFGRDGSMTTPKVGDFAAIVGNSEDEPILLLLNRESHNSEIVGFKVNLDNLKNQVLAYAIKKSTSLDLEINIVSRHKIAQLASNTLTTVEELSQVVPLWRTWL